MLVKGTLLISPFLGRDSLFEALGGGGDPGLVSGLGGCSGTEGAREVL